MQTTMTRPLSLPFAGWLARTLEGVGSKRRVQGQSADRSLAYRLKQWPSLPSALRRATVYRALTRMTLGPVTHEWFLRQCGLPAPVAASLLKMLAAGGDVEVIDLARFLQAPMDKSAPVPC